MGITRKEQLSAAIDGELSEQQIKQVLNEIKADTELRASWKNFHLISEIIQSGLASDWLSHQISVSTSHREQTEVIIEKTQKSSKKDNISKKA